MRLLLAAAIQLAALSCVTRPAREEIAFLPAPFVVPPPTCPVERILACETGGWAERIAGLKDTIKERVVSVPAFGPDGRPTDALFYVWTRDEWIFGSAGGETVVLVMPGERSLEAWGNGYFGERGWKVLKVGRARGEPERRFDDGGNLVVAPPSLPDFPRGGIVVGRGMQTALKDFFRSRGAQAGPRCDLIEIDTSWLKVGHADEIVAFVPSARMKSFAMVLPDPEAGFGLLSSVPPERALFHNGGAEAAGTVTSAGARYMEDTSGTLGRGKWRYIRIHSGRGAGQTAAVRGIENDRAAIDRVWLARGDSPTIASRYARQGICDSMPIWFDVPDRTSCYVVVEDSKMWLDGAGEEFPAVVTAGELVVDARLRKSSAACAKRIFGRKGAMRVLSAALDLPESRVIRLPVLLSTDERSLDTVSLIPNPVNCLFLDGDLVMLRPFGPRAETSDEASDVFARAWIRALERTGAGVRMLDGWNSLHRSWGGARCGTNVVRRMVPPEGPSGP